MMLDDSKSILRASIRAWLEEDIGTGDISSIATIPEDGQAKGIIHVKEAGVIAGLPVAELVFEQVDPSLVFEAKAQDGDHVDKGTVIAEVIGSTRSILAGERLALNLMQRLSGIATKTKSYADAVDGIPVRLVDTRKTTPGHRLLEKYAVRAGGGHNHRFGLYDAVMIKDNHIKGAGGVAAAIAAARSRIPHTMKIEVEVESFVQLEEALTEKPDIIMLDNMKPADMKTAVQRIKSEAPHIMVEASGGVTLHTIREIALTGVDVISVGGLTYSVHALDISLDLNERKGGPTVIIVIDVGNTNIVLGIYRHKELLNHFRISTNRSATVDEYGMMVINFFQFTGLKVEEIEGVIISSVVPPIMPTMESLCHKYLKKTPLIVGPGIKTGLNICYENPREVGADRIVNAVAGIELYGPPLIIVDFGTATTFDFIDEQGKYLGGAIAPGIGISTEALYQKAAKLPRIELVKPKSIVGRNPVQSMQAGIIYGYAGQVDGIVNRMQEEFGVRANVIATGGLAELISGESSTIQLVNPLLTLQGLQMLYERNTSPAS